MLSVLFMELLFCAGSECNSIHLWLHITISAQTIKGNLSEMLSVFKNNSLRHCWCGVSSTHSGLIVGCWMLDVNTRRIFSQLTAGNSTLNCAGE